MKRRFSFLNHLIILGGLMSFATSASAQSQEILWSALRPADRGTFSDPLPGLAKSKSQGETLAWKDGAWVVELTGFMLPIDSDGHLVYEFLLVPWVGARSHTAPPPPDQVVHVFAKEPFRLSKNYEIVSIAGALQPGLDKTQLFIMDGVKVVDLGYTMGHAQVSRVSEQRDPDSNPSHHGYSSHIDGRLRGSPGSISVRRISVAF